MRKLLTRLLGLTLATVMIFSFGCGKSGSADLDKLNFLTRDSNGNYSVIRTSENLTFYTADDSLTEFLNDYYSRHIRAGDKSIGIAKMGACWTYAKEWEAIALSWFDNSALALKEYDAGALMDKYINNMDIDKFGNSYVWFADQNFTPYEDPYNMPGQGWVFPDYREVDTYGSEFNESDDNWTVNGNPANCNGGYLSASFDGGYDEPLVFESDNISFDTERSPFIETMLNLEDKGSNGGLVTSDIGDFSVSFMTSDGNWHEVRQSEFASNPFTISQYGSYRSYFPMYLHPDWNGKVIKVRVTIYPREGTKLNTTAKIDYFRCACDTRQSTNSAKYIITTEEMTSYSNNIEMLKNNINRVRQALMFQLYALDGINGLVNLSYLQGHDSSLDGNHHRIGNGYYDIYPPCNLNLEANMYFYESLLATARMEQALIDNGITVAPASVANYDPYGVFDVENKGKGDIVWDLTVNELNELAERVKTNCQKDYDKGGFWNYETGRFCWGIYDEGSWGDAGKPLDYGMTETNIRMVFHGMATEEQAKSIYDWLDGKRIIEGDDSTGDDIYFYRFGPRTTTKDNEYDFTSIYRDEKFSIKIQDGGSTIYTSYYDVVARHNLLGADNAYDRFYQINDWYHDVMDNGGEGYGFYSSYYFNLSMQDYENAQYYTLQGGGEDGALGLDNEFYEAAMVYAIMPDAYFGMDANYSTLSLSPDMPEKLPYSAMTNLVFSGHKYDCFASDSQLIVSGITGDTTGLNMNVSFVKPSKSYKVMVNGKESTDFKEVNGKIVLTVPFNNINIEIK